MGQQEIKINKINMQYDILYKRSKTGKIVSYEIRVDTETTDDLPVIIKTTGQLEGKKTIHTETVFEGKNIGKSNETTPIQQAVSQAESDWKKKKDEGYKSLKDLGGFISSEHENIHLFLEHRLPEFNTDSVGNLKPMKAPSTPWKKGKKLSFPQLEEPKMDGLRSTLIIQNTHLDPLFWTVQFLSSGGKPYNALTHLTDIIRGNYKGPDIILDGELYCHGMTLGKINSAVKALKPSTSRIKFYVFDMPKLKATQSIRTEYVKKIVNDISNSYFPILENKIVYNEEEIIIHHDQWVSEGYEGAMLKDPDGIYQPGQRSSYWNKVKMFDDDEFKVIGYELGLRGVQDLVFICECKAGTFHAQMNGTIESKQELYDNIEECIGAQLTVKFFGYSEYGIPNLPKGKAFRDKE